MQPHRFISALIKPILLSVVLCTIAVLLLSSIRIVHNLTASLPIGDYLIYRSFDYKRGQVRTVCIYDKKTIQTMVDYGLEQDNSFFSICKNGYVPLLKRVIGLPKDSVTINQNGITVNGILIQNTAIPTSQINRLNYFKLSSYILNEGEFLVAGDSINSFDSRYFGIIKKDQMPFAAILIRSKDE